MGFILTTDEDSRALLVQGKMMEVSDNMQAAIDTQYNLLVATHTIKRNNRNALSTSAVEAKKNLGTEIFTALVDKGYQNGREITQCKAKTSERLLCIPR